MRDVVAWRRLSHSRVAPLSAAELKASSPCEVVRNVLPERLSDKILKFMVDDKEEWVRGTWWMFGKEHVAPRSSALFQLTSDHLVGSYAVAIPEKCTPDYCRYEHHYTLSSRRVVTQRAAMRLLVLLDCKSHVCLHSSFSYIVFCFLYSPGRVLA